MLKKYNLKHLKRYFPNNFELVQKIDYPSQTLYFLKHKKLETKYFHFKNKNPQNQFQILINTLPQNSKGVPLILQNLLLNGSKKFPIRDSIKNFSKNSFNEKNEIFTGLDFSIFSFSSFNKKDYENLLNLYIDTIFNSNLDKLDFFQESWFFDFENEKLVFDGKGYEEMKKYFFDQEFFVMTKNLENLMKGSEYGLNGGGDFQELKKLDFEEIKLFYKNYYHPSNVSFISSGNFDFEKNLDYLEKNLLVNYEKSCYKFIPKIPQITSPIRKYIRSPESFQKIKQNYDSQISLNFLLKNLKDSKIDFLGLNLLNLLLFEFPESPFFEEFINKGYCIGYSSGYGFENCIKYPYFSIGLKGVENNNKKFDDLKKKIFWVLEKISKNGFESDFVEMVLNRFEINLRMEYNNEILENFIGFFNYEKIDFINQFMEIDKSMKILKREIKKKHYLENLVKKYFLENKERAELIYEPDLNFGKNEILEEMKFLNEKNKNLSYEEKKEIKKKREKKKEKNEILKNL